jgi:membrane protease YdiL (CAAX protease family)
MTSYLDYARRGRTAWWRYPVTLVLAGAVAGLLGVAIVTALLVARLAPNDIALELQRPVHPFIFFTAIGLSFAVIVAGLALAARLIQRKTVADIAGRWSWKLFAAGAVVWAGCLTLATFADLLIDHGGFRWSASGATLGLAISALLGLGVQTFAEEFVFRGYLTQALLLATKRPWLAAILSGLLFGAMHIPNGSPQCVNATVVGVVTALIAIRTGGIAFTYGLHLINNLFGAVVVVSSSDVFKGSPGLITQTTPNLMWWDVASGAVMLALVAWLILSRTQRRAES